MIPNGPGPRSRLRRFLPAMLVLIGGTLLSLLLFADARKVERRQIQAEFDDLADGIHSSVRSGVAADLEALRSIGSFYDASDSVEPGEFDTFTRSPLHGYPGIRLFGWAGRLLPVGASVPQSTATSPTTLPEAPASQSLPATEAAHSPELLSGSFPVEFVAPGGEGRGLQGTDLAAVPPCREAMIRAVRADDVIATGPLEIVPGVRFDSLIFLPIYSHRGGGVPPERRRSLLQGFAVEVLRVRQLTESVLRDANLRGQEVRIYDGPWAAPAPAMLSAIDASAAQSGRLLYRAIDHEPDDRRQNVEAFPWVRSIRVAGHEWSLVGLPTSDQYAARRHWGPWAVLGGGLWVALLMAGYVHTLSGRAASVHLLVDRRTGELSAANRKLAREVSDRRDAEKAMRDAQAVYHSLVETLPQNIYRKDIEGRFTFGNRNFCVVLGHTLDEVVGKTDFDFFPEPVAAHYRADDLRVTSTGRALDLTEEHIEPSGKKLYVQVIKTPIRDPEGTIIGTQGIFWDVTDRKLAEQELEKKNRQFEEAARSERLAHTALRETHEKLKRAQTHLVQSEKLVGLGQMVAGVAHEINNPLAFVSNNVAVLQRDVKSLATLLDLYRRADPTLIEREPALHESIRELAERVDLDYTVPNLQELFDRSREGLRRIQQIVKDLRNFARLDESDLHDADLNEGIESTLNIVTGNAKKKQVRLEKDLARLPAVTCYPAKINQVVMNLIVNAIDASREGGAVTVRTRADAAQADDPTGPTVRIEVSDEGAGIDPAIRQRIFDPFFTTKPPGQGTGLGLSISYGIVQDHGGTIDVQSEMGKGTTFVITLPVEGLSKTPTGKTAGEQS